jgi:hypothetical protein
MMPKYNENNTATSVYITASREPTADARSVSRHSGAM